MFQKGFTLAELLLVAVLIPILGLTLVQLDLFTEYSFKRMTDRMLPEQEVETALGFMERDVSKAVSVTVYNDPGWSVVVPPGNATPGDRVQITINDNNTPLSTTDDDRVRYSISAGTILRQYSVNGGAFDAGQVVARNITVLSLLQTVEQTALPQQPQNVLRATVTAVLGGATVTRTRFITSRALRAAP